MKKKLMLIMLICITLIPLSTSITPEDIAIPEERFPYIVKASALDVLLWKLLHPFTIATLPASVKPGDSTMVTITLRSTKSCTQTDAYMIINFETPNGKYFKAVRHRVGRIGANQDVVYNFRYYVPSNIPDDKLYIKAWLSCQQYFPNYQISSTSRFTLNIQKAKTCKPGFIGKPFCEEDFGKRVVQVYVYSDCRQKYKTIEVCADDEVCVNGGCIHDYTRSYDTEDNRDYTQWELKNGYYNSNSICISYCPSIGAYDCLWEKC